jgi:hypothetical protein
MRKLLFLFVAFACRSAARSDLASSSALAPIPSQQAKLVLLPPGLAGQKVAVYPISSMALDPKLNWSSTIRVPGARAHADSILDNWLVEEFPKVVWVLPAEVRRAAQQAPGLVVGPDQVATEALPRRMETPIGEPMRAQLRQLTAIATGGRYILVPVALAFVAGSAGTGQARLVVTLCDIRAGVVAWSATLAGDGDTPWQALEGAARQLISPAP